MRPFEISSNVRMTHNTIGKEDMSFTGDRPDAGIDSQRWRWMSAVLVNHLRIPLLILVVLSFCWNCEFLLESSVFGEEQYVVVVSRRTYYDIRWQKVVDSLVKKHQGKLLFYNLAVKDLERELQRLQPEYACFVSRPQELNAEFCGRGASLEPGN